MAASPAPHSLSLTRVAAQRDILGSDRFVLVFDSIPGSDPGGVAADEVVAILCNEVTFPQVQVGHVRVPLFGQPIAFRGGIDHQNRFTASFYEQSDGVVLKAFWAWLNQVRNLEGDDSAEKSAYAINCEVLKLDTTGRTAYAFDLEAVWPINITPGALGEDGSPLHHAVEFSFDRIALQAEGEQS